jgi:hypothetical protein
MTLQLNERLEQFESPFRRLDALLADRVPAPGLAPVLMHVGEPQDAPPSLLADAVAAHATEWNRYPPSLGTPAFVSAAAGGPIANSPRWQAPARPSTWPRRWPSGRGGATRSR